MLCSSAIDWHSTVYRIDIISYSLRVFIFSTSNVLWYDVNVPFGDGHNTLPATKKHFSLVFLRHKSHSALCLRLSFLRGRCSCEMFFIGFMFLGFCWLVLLVLLFVCFCVGVHCLRVSVEISLFGAVCSMCVLPYGIALFSIEGLLVIGVGFSFRIFLTALSIFGVDIVEVKFVGMSGLLGEATMKSYLLSDVYTLMGLFCVESDVRVITSIVGDFVIYSSFIRMNDLFCCFPIWSLDCCRVAALDFAQNVSLGLCLNPRFPESFVFVSFWGTVCCIRRHGDNCCLCCCLFVFDSRFCFVFFSFVVLFSGSSLQLILFVRG